MQEVSIVITRVFKTSLCRLPLLFALLRNPIMQRETHACIREFWFVTFRFPGQDLNGPPTHDDHY